MNANPGRPISCPRCGSTNIKKPVTSVIVCYDCGRWSHRSSKGAIVELRGNPAFRGGHSPDAVAARELYLFILNDVHLYAMQHLPIIKNLIRKIGRGVYDKRLAVKLFMYLADEGARRYGKESGSGYSLKGFDKPTRFYVAAMLARDFMDTYRSGEYTEEFMKLGKGKLLNPHTLPGLAGWDMFAGGTSANEGVHSYSKRGDFGEYHIMPTSRGRMTTYHLRWADTMGLLGGGLWSDLGKFSHPASAAKAARAHALGLPDKSPYRQSNPRRGLTRQGPACYATGMARRNPHELYISKARRDARFKELKARGVAATRRSIRGQQLHPQYIKDAREEGISYETGFGNTDYRSLWPVLYSVDFTENPYTRVRFPAHTSRLFRSKKSGRWTSLPGKRRNPISLGYVRHSDGSKTAHAQYSRSRSKLTADMRVSEDIARKLGPKYGFRGIVSDGTKAYMHLPNPRKGAVLIGRRVMSVVYLDEAKARRCGAKNPSIPWKHDFSSADAKVYGLPDGSVLIKSDKKKLWGYR